MMLTTSLVFMGLSVLADPPSKVPLDFRNTPKPIVR